MARNDELATRFFEEGKQLSASVTVQRPAAEIYRAWTDSSGASSFVHWLRSAGLAPHALLDVALGNAVDGAREGEYDGRAALAEVIAEEPGRRVAWRTAGSPPIPNAGSITLHELPYSRGTEVKVIVDYVPPQGALRKRVDALLGKEPEAMLKLLLFRFRQLLETGELATTRGQPSGRREGHDVAGSEDERILATLEVRP